MYVCVFLRMCQIWFVQNIDRHISKTASVWVAGIWWAKGIDNLMSPCDWMGPWTSMSLALVRNWMDASPHNAQQICVCHMQIICEKIPSVHFNLFWTKLDLHKLQNMFNLPRKKQPSFRLKLLYKFLLERYVHAEDVGDVWLNTPSPWSQHS